MNLSSGTFTNFEIRGLIHCLNAHGEIDALEKLTTAASDAELAPISQLINELIVEQPKSLFTLRELYRNSEKNGDLGKLENTLSQMFSDPNQNKAFSSSLQKITAPVFDLLLDDSTSFDSGNLYALLKAKAYQRLGTEYFDNDGLKKFLVMVVRYVNTDDAKSISTLYRILSETKADQSFKAAVSGDEQSHVQNIAHFFEWLAKDDHYGLMARSVREMLNANVTCFDHGKNIPNPVLSVLRHVSSLDAKTVKPFFTHEIKNTYLLAQGYCSFPYQKSPLMHLIDQATDVKGFEEAFLAMKPLLSNPDFIDFMGSRAAENFMKDMGGLTDQHFFQDLFTLASLHLDAPLTNNGDQVAKTLDGILTPLKESDVQTLLNFFAPVLSKSDHYGLSTAKTVRDISSGFPDISTGISKALRHSVAQSLSLLIQKPELPPLLDLTHVLVGNGKLNGIVNQLLTYLSNAVEKGRFVFEKKKQSENFASTAPSANYLADKIIDTTSQKSVCDQLNLDWSFTKYLASSSAEYVAQLQAIQSCVDANQSFTRASDLIKYSIERGTYASVTEIQKTLVNTLVSRNTDLAFASIEDLLSINALDSNTIGKILNLSGSSLGIVKDAFLKYTQFRNFIAELIRSPELSLAVAEATAPTQKRLRSSEPILDLVHLKLVDAIVDRDTSMKQVPVLDALKSIMTYYCPSLDAQMADCDIDEDQVTLFKQSPKALYEQIANEELNSIQSWMHPKLATHWKHQAINPPDVSTFEFHFNPTLQLLHKSPQAPQAVLNALARTQKDLLPLNKFIKTRAVHFTMIPYVFAVANYPEISSKEYHPRTRIRILNDLDRLELISINADFKAFNLVKNIGMNFLQQIALAWGDVDPGSRPKDIDKFIDPESVETLSDVRDYIKSEMNKYDKRSLQALGNCDPRGRGRLGRWWATHFCSGEISDISARIFNLRFLIPLIDEEMPEKNGGKGGMIFLRDLFYALYEKNTDTQRGQYADGVTLNDACLESPLSTNGPIANCQKDLLTFVPRIAHLGLLHQAGMAVVQAQDHPVDAISSLLNRVSSRKDLSDLFVNVASSDAGIQFLTDAVDYGFQAPAGIGRNLSLIAQMLTLPLDLTWTNLAFEMALKDPQFPTKNKALINALLTIDANDLAPKVDHWISDPKLAMPRFLELLSQKLVPAARKDAVDLISDLTPHTPELARYLKSAKNLPDLESSHIQENVHAWALEFANPNFAASRDEFATWTLSPEFKEFCDVFSDSSFIEKTYKFFESARLNPDSEEFLRTCRDYLIPR